MDVWFALIPLVLPIQRKISEFQGNSEIHIILLSSKWCLQDSNRGHTDFQSDALPPELRHLALVS